MSNLIGRKNNYLNCGSTLKKTVLCSQGELLSCHSLENFWPYPGPFLLVLGSPGTSLTCIVDDQIQINYATWERKDEGFLSRF